MPGNTQLQREHLCHSVCNLYIWDVKYILLLEVVLCGVVAHDAFDNRVDLVGLHSLNDFVYEVLSCPALLVGGHRDGLVLNDAGLPDALPGIVHLLLMLLHVHLRLLRIHVLVVSVLQVHSRRVVHRGVHRGL